MSAFLKYIEVENFKSYEGFMSIGPLKRFTAVIGPNGSGKSNFMDAISFVMGEKTDCLRVKQLSELIHGAAIGRPVSNRCFVTAKFELADGTNIDFQRSVIDFSADYKINGKGVESSVYLEELEKLGINVKAKNFLVFQGAVESIAMKNAKERTALFEEISGSGLLKDEYNRLKYEMQQAEEETQNTYQKKRCVAAERKEAIAEEQEADRYARLEEEVAEQQFQCQLFRLYYIEKDIQRLANKIKEKQGELASVRKNKEQADEVLKDKKKQAGKVTRELAELEQKIRVVESEMNKKHPMFIKAKEKVLHSQNKLTTAKINLEHAKKADEAHSADIEKLEEEMIEIQRTNQEIEQKIADEYERRGTNIVSAHIQVEEYGRLKQKAKATAAKYVGDLESMNREQKSDQDLLDNETNKKEHIEGQLEKFRLEKEEVQKRMEKLFDHIKLNEQALQDQNRIKERIVELQKELANVRDQLGNAKVEKHEDVRRKIKQEVVELFEREVPGVYDRMINMCQPTHERYNVAVTKVLGKYMEAIIVDTEETARRCIQILNEQRLEVETFLPLDYLPAKPLKQRLRDIKEPKQVKLVYDVLKFNSPEIEKAVLFATNNALVCETREDAMKVAYGIDRSRYDALALDGTFYQKSGIISGGSRDLSRKAKLWDEKLMAPLKSLKEKLIEDLSELMKKARKGSELATVESQKKDLETSKKSIETYERKLQELETELNAVSALIGTIERRMQQRNLKIEEIKQNMNTVEDRVFADFCKKIGVANIRQFEECELVLHQELDKMQADFDQHIGRITSRLHFEKTKDTKVNVQRWERIISGEEDVFEKCKQNEEKQRAAIEEDKAEIEQLKSEKQEKKKDVDNMEKDTNKARHDVATLAKEIHNINYQISSIDTEVETKRNERHNILIQSKSDDIMIPMMNGNLNDIDQGGDDQNESTAVHSSAVLARESLLQIDYSKLPRNVLELNSNEAIKKMNDTLQKEMQSKQDTLERIQTPNLKVIQNLESVSEKIAATNEEFENARRKAKKAKSAFEKVKNQRYEKFKACCDHITEEIDGIYKSLERNEAAQADLGPDNPEEPYLEGINYNCVASGKRFQPMSNLTGGEKTIAALALLFAIHSYQPAPFFVLDEIDAALDNTNIGKVASYIVEKTKNLQTIVISLKEEFYGSADALVGITPDPGNCLISRVYTYDLTQFEDNLN